MSPPSGAAIYNSDNFPGNITINGFNVTSSDSIGIWLAPVINGDVTITNCIASNTDNEGILAEFVNGNIIVRDCIFNNNAETGIVLADVSGDVEISNCTANNNGQSESADGITCAIIGGNVIIKNCTANGNPGDGIHVFDIIGDVTIENCTTQGNKVDGIELGRLSGDDNRVECNNISGNSVCGLQLKDGNFLVEAPNNWWGESSGPKHYDNLGGNGDRICEEDEIFVFSGTVIYTPWLSGPFEITFPCGTAPAPIPSLSIWGVILLAVSMAGPVFWINRRRKRTG